MQITVNNRPMILQNPIPLQKLLEQLEQNGKKVALAVNQKIISRTCWQQTLLQEGDRVTIVTATAGG